MATLEIYPDAGGAWRWRLLARNGERVAASGEAFASRSGARRAAANFSVKADGWAYEVYADAAGAFRWRARSRNRQLVAASGEAFASKANANRAVAAVKRAAAAAGAPVTAAG